MQKMKTLKLTAAPGDEGTRLDVFVASNDPTLSRSAAARLAEEDRISVNGKGAKKNYRLGAGDVVLSISRPGAKHCPRTSRLTSYTRTTILL